MSRGGASAKRPADEAARAILRPAFDQVLSLEARVANDGDASALHALRIALRRMRSVLRELEGVLPERERDALAKSLRKLAHTTSPVRDLDVLCVAFDRYRDAIAEPHRRHLEPLRRALDAERERSFRALCAEMTASRRRRLEATFARFEAAELETKSVPSLESVVRARAERVGRRIRRRGRRAGPASDPAELHELRKDVKRLRYLLELFRSAFPGRERRALVRDLEALQDALGELQDLVAHRRILERRALAGLARGGPKVYVAAGMLLEHLDVAQAEARAAIPKAFRSFDTKKAKGHLREATRR